jgi:hypothetical protein
MCASLWCDHGAGRGQSGCGSAKLRLRIEQGKGKKRITLQGLEDYRITAGVAWFMSGPCSRLLSCSLAEACGIEPCAALTGLMVEKPCRQGPMELSAPPL